MTSSPPPAAREFPVGTTWPGPTTRLVQLRRNLAAEWTKLRSVRSTVAALLATVVVCVGFALVLGFWAVANWDRLGAKQHASFQPATVSVNGVFFGQLVIGALGVLSISSEYSTGTIRATLSATPQRLLMYLTKITMFAGLAFGVALTTTMTAFLGTQAILHRKHLGLGLFDPGVLRIVVGAALFLVAVALLGLGLGTIIRHTAGAISTVFGLMFVLSLLGGFLPDDWQAQVDKWLPLNAGMTVMQVAQEPDRFGPWTGLALLYGYTLIALIAGAIVLIRRDA